mgnify:FL=1
MKVLVLSCATGGGHNACGAGIAEALTDCGHVADFMPNYLALHGKLVDRAVCGAYVKSVKACPAAFRGVYHIGRAVSTFNHNINIKSPVYYANAGMAGHLAEVIEKGHYDAIVMPHLYPVETITWMTRNGYRLPLTVAVATDYTSIPFWEETDSDYYVIPHEDCVEDFVRRGIDRDKLIPLGIPAPRDYTANDKRTANDTCSDILVMGGSMGAGRMSQIVGELRGGLIKNGMPECSITAVCGNNEKLHARMLENYGNDRHINVLGYVNNVYDYMNKCDVIFTKPGGLTATQSAIMRIPAVFMEPLSDCEKANSGLFVRHGMAIAPKRENLVDEGMALISSWSRRQQMIEAQKRCIKGNCGMELVHIIEELCR